MHFPRAFCKGRCIFCVNVLYIRTINCMIKSEKSLLYVQNAHKGGKRKEISDHE